MPYQCQTDIGTSEGCGVKQQTLRMSLTKTGMPIAEIFVRVQNSCASEYPSTVCLCVPGAQLDWDMRSIVCMLHTATNRSTNDWLKPYIEYEL